MNEKSFKKIYNLLDRYSSLKEDEFKETDRVFLEIDGGINVFLDEAELSLEEAALAIVVYNDVEVRWYKKSRNRGLGANFETETRTVLEWLEMAQKFLKETSELTVDNWTEYLTDYWPDNYDDVEEEDDED